VDTVVEKIFKFKRRNNDSSCEERQRERQREREEVKRCRERERQRQREEVKRCRERERQRQREEVKRSRERGRKKERKKESGRGEESNLLHIDLFILGPGRGCLHQDNISQQDLDAGYSRLSSHSSECPAIV
jgi:hypothetical protein